MSEKTKRESDNAIRLKSSFSGGKLLGIASCFPDKTYKAR
jgi:hypothetical protein